MSFGCCIWLIAHCRILTIRADVDQFMTFFNQIVYRAYYFHRITIWNQDFRSQKFILTLQKMKTVNVSLSYHTQKQERSTPWKFRERESIVFVCVCGGGWGGGYIKCWNVEENFPGINWLGWLWKLDDNIFHSSNWQFHFCKTVKWLNINQCQFGHSSHCDELELLFRIATRTQNETPVSQVSTFEPKLGHVHLGALFWLANFESFEPFDWIDWYLFNVSHVMQRFSISFVPDWKLKNFYRFLQLPRICWKCNFFWHRLNRSKNRAKIQDKNTWNKKIIYFFIVLAFFGTYAAKIATLFHQNWLQVEYKEFQIHLAMNQ